MEFLNGEKLMLEFPRYNCETMNLHKQNKNGLASCNIN